VLRSYDLPLSGGLFDWSVRPTTTIIPTFFEHRYSRLLLNVYKLCKPNPPIDLHPRHQTCRLANPLIAPPPFADIATDQTVARPKRGKRDYRLFKDGSLNDTPIEPEIAM
jgi:hypothetical protein